MKIPTISVNHLINKYRSPSSADKAQQAFNLKRLTKFEKAVSTRPVFIPLRFNLKAAGQIPPYTLYTTDLNYPVIILGFMTNDATKEMNFRRSETDKPFFYNGNDVNVRLTLKEVCGTSDAAGDGLRGMFYLPQPIELRAFSRLKVDVFKTVGNGQTEIVDVVLVGLRVFSRNFGESLLNDEQKGFLQNSLKYRSAPETVLLKQQATFDANGKARIYTPQADEPLLIVGMQSTFVNSLVKVWLETEESWTVSLCPMWALAKNNAEDPYRMFPRPVFLPRGTSLTMELENATGDDADANTGTITWLCLTI